MKVFISWSGELSKIIAEQLKSFLETTIQATKPFFSSSVIEKGERWFQTVSKELELSNYCLICLTKENITAPWIMFEVGAISKNLDKSKICPILFNISPTDLKGPLVQFQSCSFHKDDFWLLFKNINKELNKDSLEIEILKSIFDKSWSEFQNKINTYLDLNVEKNDIPLRDDRDILIEILENMRNISKRIPKNLVNYNSEIEYKPAHLIYKALEHNDFSIKYAPNEGTFSTILNVKDQKEIIDFDELEKIVYSINSESISVNQNKILEKIKFRVYQIYHEIQNVLGKTSRNLMWG